ncbi:response regulator transcription factor [Actinospica sp. MGRD01-02]|uniref:Response regulator transcription factor n=1 Tax=Actinospica acidithermotolerans TaxID=2828514 RepID=A0A941IG53_9ACTN|nr:response regulator transcription factor [Actinospica acidithermotolerans]MBR7825749.1 response regulator transcription factor [Actinospica acidithermotolerans]
MIPAARETAADVLVVDDDPTVAEVVAAYLHRTGHEVRLVNDGPAAVAAARTRLPDLVVLDLMLPGYDGFEVFRRIRQLGPVCVIMLTARASEQDRILGLELGADDYVTKPFSPRELALRVRSVLRRTDRPPLQPAETADLLRHGPLEVDLARHEARCGGRLLNLTVREFDLLAFLLAHPRQVYTRADLMHQVWGWEYGDQSTVTVHVRRLREKIEADPALPRYLVTVWGVGYRLDDPEHAAEAEARDNPSQPGDHA